MARHGIEVTEVTLVFREQEVEETETGEAAARSNREAEVTVVIIAVRKAIAGPNVPNGWKNWKKLQNQNPCYVCKKPGHTMLDLHKCDRAKETVPGNAATVPDISDSMRTPLHADVCNKKTPWRDQHVYPGILIKGKEIKSVTVLRDTGSAVHAVHSNLVNDRDYTGRYQQLVTFCGKEESVPLAYIQVNTPFLSGKVLACVLQSYPEKFRYYDILIGNGGVLESPVAADPSPKFLRTWERWKPTTSPRGQVTRI